MVKLRRACDGSYFIVIKRAIVESQGWKEGNEVTLLSLKNHNIEKGDYLLRKKDPDLP
jgi:hypothetical protein